MGVGFWLGLAAFLIVGLGVANAQYTGAKPYSSEFGYKLNHADDSELRLTNESDYSMVVALEQNGIVVDHAYVSKHQTHVFRGLPAGRYVYKAEIHDRSDEYNYIESSDSFTLDTNICPEGYTCDGRAYMTLQIYYSVAYGSPSDRPKDITKSQFFN